MDALRLNPASTVLRRAWLASRLSSHRRLLLHAQRVAQPTPVLSHGPLTLYILPSFSATNTAWFVRRVTTYI